jgi:hypothetical protein
MQQPPPVFLVKREVTEMIKTCSSIERIWGGVKVCEARKPLRVFLLPTDIKGAESHDPTNCAFARAVRRMCGGRAVFLRRTAYIELMQPNGEKRVERFVMPENMRAIVEAFDKRGVPARRFHAYPAHSERKAGGQEEKGADAPQGPRQGHRPHRQGNPTCRHLCQTC